MPEINIGDTVAYASAEPDDYDLPGDERPRPEVSVLPAGSLAAELAEPLTIVASGVSADLLRNMAHLIVRQAMALADEGIGPEGPEEPTDAATYTEAVALVRDQFVDHELWDFGLVSDDDHDPDGCDRCARLARPWRSGGR